ncbi:MAG: hypothetical protein KatS3mg081_2663 [Gemmatimonadales bacterium]|nr:MAG: hypothetical protein KatS3mg081_2663 [Gemmatimonadales bacterium]
MAPTGWRPFGLLTLLVLAGCSRATETDGPGIVFTAVANGLDQTCGLDADGTAYCWSERNPVVRPLPGSVRFTAISIWSGHGCGIAPDGAAYCWGIGTQGQLGTTETSGRCGNDAPYCSLAPVPVSGNLRFTQISVGLAHSCGVTTERKLYCWGWNEFGQLGTEEELECATDPQVDCSSRPVRVASDVEFTSVAAGLVYTCAIAVSRDAFCWGSGSSGKLGNGSLEDRALPVIVAGDLEFKTLSARGAHTCGVTVSSEVYCWGSNADLQLGSTVAEETCGVGLLKCVSTPHRVPTELRFEDITVGGPVPLGDGPLIGGHTCGRTAAGEVYCWGGNEQGQVLGSQNLRESTPVALPIRLRFRSISAGFANTCGLTDGGEAICWSYGTPIAR